MPPTQIYYTADPESDMGRTAATVADGISALGKAMHGCYW